MRAGGARAGREVGFPPAAPGGAAETGGMTTYRARPVEAAALKQLRQTDDADRVPRPFTDEEGGAPLRCCLRASRAGEQLILVSYAPLRRWAAETGADPAAYDEQGPVFLHARECDGPADPAAGGEPYPFARPGALRALRRYDRRGHIAGGRMIELPFDTCEAFDAALDEAFGDPEVVLVHVRAVEYGCYHFEVRRP